MIPIPKSSNPSKIPVVRLVGLGNAGVNIADRITIAGGLTLDAVAMNSDQQSLYSSVAATKISLGPLTTRGLGSGGDPEIGLDAARESQAEIEEALAGSDIVFLCGGLGGGTASGAAGFLAELAKQAGALLVAVVTTPFAFEGKRRASQAAAALREIRSHADAVLHFENDRMAELTAPRAGVAETFAACDHILGGCVAAITRLVSAPGPLGVGLPDLLAVLKSTDGPCLFGSGSATGDNRAHEALERALASPLLDRGRLLDEAASVLVHLSGPRSLSFAEVGTILQEVSRQSAEGSMLHLGVSTLPDPDEPVVLTIIAKTGSTTTAALPPFIDLSRRIKNPPPEAPHTQSSLPEAFAHPSTADATPPRITPPHRPSGPQPQRTPAAHKSAPQKVRQETLQFDPIARGRFEKSDPTIEQGEDLDQPTFLRMKKTW